MYRTVQYLMFYGVFFLVLFGLHVYVYYGLNRLFKFGRPGLCFTVLVLMALLFPISSLLEIKKIRVGSFLPALVITPLIVYVLSLF